MVDWIVGKGIDNDKLKRNALPRIICALVVPAVLIIASAAYASYREYELFNQGYEYYLAYEPEKAAESLNAFLSEFPESSAKDAAFFWLGKSLVRMKAFEKARDIFMEIKRQFPESPFVPFAEIEESETLKTMAEEENRRPAGNLLSALDTGKSGGNEASSSGLPASSPDAPSATVSVATPTPEASPAIKATPTLEATAISEIVRIPETAPIAGAAPASEAIPITEAARTPEVVLTPEIAPAPEAVLIPEIAQIPETILIAESIYRAFIPLPYEWRAHLEEMQSAFVMIPNECRADHGSVMHASAVRSEDRSVLEKEVSSFLNEYISSYKEGNIGRFISLYSTSAVERGRMTYVDIKMAYEKIFARNRYEYTLTNISSNRSESGNQGISVAADYRIEKLSGAGKGSVVKGRIRWTLLKEGESLKIARVDYD